MKSFAEKVKDARAALGIKQSELGQLVGVSTNTIYLYEKGSKKPRATTMKKLADALQVSVTFLSDDTCDDPMKNMEQDNYIEEARKRYGAKGARQAAALTEELTGLFAGGDLSEEDMDAMMKAVQEAYWIAKEKNRKYTPKKYREGGK